MVDVRYADSGGLQIAYAVLDRGQRASGDDVDIIVAAGAFFSFEMLLEDRVARRFLDGLADIGRVAVFDKRGVGASDPITDWERSAQDQWVEDLVSVVDAVALRRPVLVSWETFGLGRLATSQHPDLFRSLVLIDPTSDAGAFLRLLDGGERSQRLISIETIAFPSRIGDPDFQEWMTRAGRAGASPSTAARMWEHVLSFSGPMTPPGIDVETLVLHRADSIHPEAAVRHVASLIERAEFVEVPGHDAYPISGDVDPLLIEISRFVSGHAAGPAPDHHIGVVLFTDLVGSTDRAAQEGDERWRALLDHHDTAMERIVVQHGGRVVKFVGDGMLAELPSASASLRAARYLQQSWSSSGFQLRIGIHVGDVDRRGDDISGMTVNIAARIMDCAAADDIVVSTSVRDAAIGTPARFGQLEPVRLKGVPGTWTLFRYEAVPAAGDI